MADLMCDLFGTCCKCFFTLCQINDWCKDCCSVTGCINCCGSICCPNACQETKEEDSGEDLKDGKVDSAGGEPESKDNNGETITTQPLNTKETEES